MQIANFFVLAVRKKARPLLYTNMTLTKTPIPSKRLTQAFLGWDRRTVVRSGYFLHNLTESTVLTVLPKNAWVRQSEAMSVLVRVILPIKSGLGFFLTALD